MKKQNRNVFAYASTYFIIQDSQMYKTAKSHFLAVKFQSSQPITLCSMRLLARWIII